MRLNLLRYSKISLPLDLPDFARWRPASRLYLYNMRMEMKWINLPLPQLYRKTIRWLPILIYVDGGRLSLAYTGDKKDLFVLKAELDRETQQSKELTISGK
jgi:hypothetical protein